MATTLKIDPELVSRVDAEAEEKPSCPIDGDKWVVRTSAEMDAEIKTSASARDVEIHKTYWQCCMCCRAWYVTVDAVAVKE